MVKLRLARFGKKGEPHYRLVAIQGKEKRESNAIEYLGYYNPRTKPSTFEIKEDRVKYWLGVGAQPTETVARFLAKQGLLKVEKKTFSKKPGRKTQERSKAKAEQSAKAEEAKKPEAAEAPAEAPSETPVQPESPAPEAEAAKPESEAAQS